MRAEATVRRWGLEIGRSGGRVPVKTREPKGALARRAGRPVPSCRSSRAFFPAKMPYEMGRRTNRGLPLQGALFAGAWPAS